MVNNSDTYQIIDEPKASKLSHFVQNPLIILFASLIIPIFWMPPALGRFWIPLLWLLFNGYALGSATWKKEWIICTVGALVMFGLLIGITQYAQSGATFALPYFRIALNSTLLLTLYYAIFTQSTSYDLFEYMRNKG